MNVIESLECKIDATKDIHRILSCTGCVSVAALNVAVHSSWLEPDARVHIKDGQVVKCHLTIPSAKYIHVMLVDHGCMAKPNFGFWEQ